MGEERADQVRCDGLCPKERFGCLAWRCGVRHGGSRDRLSASGWRSNVSAEDGVCLAIRRSRPMTFNNILGVNGGLQRSY
jgi:hypothetical protein